MPSVLVVADSFKGTLAAAEVAAVCGRPGPLLEPVGARIAREQP